MIQKLKIKLISTSVISIFIVMFTILGISNFIIYKSFNNRTDKLIEIITKNDGQFPKKFKFQDDKTPRPKPNNISISEEAPYETRFFTIIFNDKGDIQSTNMGFVVAVSNQDAIDMAKRVYSGKKEIGYIGNYKYKISEYKEGKILVFLDCTRELQIQNLFLKISFFVLLISMITVYIIVYFFSKIAVKPIEESYKKQKQFITDASHEIKTPLAIIDANTDIIEIENGVSQWTKSNKNQVQRLTNLTNNLVSLAKMDEEISVETEEICLSDIILEEIEEYKNIANLKGKSLNTDIEKNISYFGNSNYIRQMIGIFLDNAIKYSKENDDINLSLKKQGKKIEIIIKNKVENISSGNYDILFERFYRLDSSRNSDTGGYGIGLSLAKAIITMHKGKVSAKVQEDKIEFKIIL